MQKGNMNAIKGNINAKRTTFIQKTPLISKEPLMQKKQH